MPQANRTQPRTGFSFTEVIVVVGIIGMLLTLTSMAIQRVRDAAAKLSCQSNLRQIGIAISNYHTDYGYIPPNPFREIRRNGTRATIEYMNWMVQLLPYIERDNLWNQTLRALEIDKISTHNPPHAGLATVIPLYTCPTDNRLRQAWPNPDGVFMAYTSYLGVAGGSNEFNGMIHSQLVRFAEVTDGLSQTLMVGERPPPDTFQAGNWYGGLIDPRERISQLRRGPSYYMHTHYRGGWYYDCQGEGYYAFGPGRTDEPCDRHHFWSLHPGGANFCFGDGSVRFLRYSAMPIMAALGTRNGGEVVEIPD